MGSSRREKRRPVIEWGLVAALLLVILILEIYPSAEIGRLSTRVTDEILIAVDAYLPFDTSVEDKEEEILEQQSVIEQQVEESVREIVQEVALSLSENTLGLSTASTVQTTAEELLQPEPDEEESAGPPRFMATEVVPVCSYRTVPEYPDIAKRAGIEGTVTLWIYIASTGSVEHVELYNSSGANILDQSAVSAAWNTRWFPAQNNDVAIGVWTTLQYRFQLQQ